MATFKFLKKYAKDSYFIKFQINHSRPVAMRLAPLWLASYEFIYKS